MALNYGLYDKDSVTQGYFGDTTKTTPKSASERLASLGVSSFQTEQPKKKGLNLSIVGDSKIDTKTEKENISGFDIGVKTGEALQDIGGALKVESKFETGDVGQAIEEGGILGGLKESFKNQAKRLANSLRVVPNLTGDTIEFAGEMTTALSDIVGTAKGIKDISVGVADKLGLVEGTEEQKAIVDAIGQELEKNFGTGERALETITQNPLDTISAVFGASAGAKASLKASKLGNTAKGQQIIQTLDKLEEATNPINAVKGQLALGKEVVGTALETAGDVGKTLTSKVSGLNPETLTTLFKNPDLVNQGITREGTANKVVNAIDRRVDEVGDLGREYQTIREYTGPINTTDIIPENILDRFNISAVDGKLDFSKSSIASQGNKNAIQNAYDLIQERKNNITSGNDMLSFRQAIDDTINYKTEATGPAEKIVREMRGQIDEVAKRDIPGLKELDNKFKTEITELNDIRKLIYDKSGNLKDNYIQTISNLTGKGKEVKLDRVKKLVPEIEDEINALKALEDVEIAKGNKVATYAQGGGIALGVTGTLDPITTLSILALTNPTIVTNLVRGAGYSARIVGSITEKIKKGIKLTKQEENIVSKTLQEQIQNANTVEDLLNNQ